jgi:hypothetical protein
MENVEKEKEWTIEGEKNLIRDHIGALSSLTRKLHTMLMSLPDLDERITALKLRSKSEPSDLSWQVTKDMNEIEKGLHIFSKLTYEADQEGREAKKFPSVIQLDRQRHALIHHIICEINVHKDALNASNQRLKANVGKLSAQVWQEVKSYASIIQILRHISIIDDDVSYLGISFMIKPVVKRLSKERAIEILESKIEFCTERSSALSRVPFLSDVKAQISNANEDAYEIKMARQGSPRFMVNAKGKAKNYQVMASMPVFVFTEGVHPVNLPAGRKRQPRKDKRIPLGEVKSEFGLYLVPKPSR